MSEDSDPMVRLDPHDARTAQSAGVSFARALVGATSAWFLLALEEQEAIIRSGVQRAGYPARNANMAADAFDAGAHTEWTRIANAAQAQTGSA